MFFAVPNTATAYFWKFEKFEFFFCKFIPLKLPIEMPALFHLIFYAKSILIYPLTNLIMIPLNWFVSFFQDGAIFQKFHFSFVCQLSDYNFLEN